MRRNLDSYIMLYSLTLTHSLVVHGIPFFAQTRIGSASVSAHSFPVSTLLTGFSQPEAFVDVVITLVSFPPRQTHTASNGVTVAGTQPTFTEAGTVVSIGTVGAVCSHSSIRVQVSWHKTIKSFYSSPLKGEAKTLHICHGLIDCTASLYGSKIQKV